MEFLPSLLTLAGMHLLMAMLPGPNTVVVSWLSATTSRAEGLRAAGQRAAVLTLPDSLCWLLNIRGADVPRNPVLHGFAILHDDARVTVFADPAKFDAATRAQRQAAIFEPFHRRLGELIDQRLAAGVPLRLVGVHSFTPSYRGVPRPWSAGVLFDRAAGYAERIIAGLRQGDEAIGANQPYQIDPAEDMTVPVHGDERGLDAVLIEIRNDGLRTPEAVAAWAERLAPWL